MPSAHDNSHSNKTGLRLKGKEDLKGPIKMESVEIDFLSYLIKI